MPRKLTIPDRRLRSGETVSFLMCFSSPSHHRFTPVPTLNQSLWPGGFDYTDCVGWQTTISKGPRCHLQPGKGGAVGTWSGGEGSWEGRRHKLEKVMAWLGGPPLLPLFICLLPDLLKPQPPRDPPTPICFWCFSEVSTLIITCPDAFRRVHILLHITFKVEMFPPLPPVSVSLHFPKVFDKRDFADFAVLLSFIVFPWHDNFTRKIKFLMPLLLRFIIVKTFCFSF